MDSDAWWRERSLSMRSFPPPVPHRMESMRGPAYSNWVLKNHVLAGPHPGSVSTADMVKNLTKLLEAGVTTFVCLQHEMPRPHIKGGAAVTGAPPASSRLRSSFGTGVVVHAKPYIEDAQIICDHARLPQTAGGRPLTFLHLPIHDSKGATTEDDILAEFVISLIGHIKAGELLYIQCGDGDGRTGTVSAVLLGLVYELSSSEALDLAQRCRNSRAGTEGHCPDTHEQKMQVHRLLARPGFREKAKATAAISSMEVIRNPEKDLSQLLTNIRTQLGRGGQTAISRLRRSFPATTRRLSLFELTRTLKTNGVNLTDDEQRLLTTAFASPSGDLDVDAFLNALRGHMNDMREALVRQAFAALDEHCGDAPLTLDAMARMYAGSNHPDVKAGRRSEADVVTEFLEMFKVRSNTDGIVALADFVDYYTDVSAAIEDDNYFQLMMWNAWPFKSRIRAGAKEVGVMAGSAGSSFAPAPVAPEAALAEARSAMSAVGDFAVPLFRQALHDQDSDQDGWVQLPEFSAAAASLRSTLSPEAIEGLFKAGRPDRGSVNIEEFLSFFAGRLSPFRRRLVVQAFRQVDRDGDGNADLDTVIALFNADRHPAVMAGRQRSEQLYRKFLSTFSEGIRGKVVTLTHFERFFEGVSVAFDDDDAFQMMMWNVWGLGSGRTASASRAEATPETAYSRAREGDEGFFGALDRLNSIANRPSPAKKPVGRQLFADHRAAATSVAIGSPSPSRRAGAGAGAGAGGPGRGPAVPPPPAPSDMQFSGDRGKRLHYASHDKVYAASAATQFEDKTGPYASDEAEVARLREQFVAHSRVSTPPASVASVASPQKLTASIRSACAERGVKGLQGLERRLLNAARGNPNMASRTFVDTLRDAVLPLGPSDYETLVRYYDAAGRGYVDARRFMEDVRGRLEGHRLELVTAAFAQLDDGSGLVSLDKIRLNFNAKDHPDVKSRHRTEAEVLREFLETCDIGHDGSVSLSEFVQYYTGVSAGIEDDNYFQLLVWNSWNLKGSRGSSAAAPFSPQSRKLAAGVNATSAGEYHLSGAGVSPQVRAKVYGLPPTRQSASSAGAAAVDLPGVLERLRTTFARRGIHGIMELSRSFKILDKDRSGYINKEELARAMSLYGIALSEPELDVLFRYYDRDDNRQISFQEFIRGFRGEMPKARLDLVHQAFRKMDLDGSGVIDIEDIALCYNPREIPEVASGKKSERDALKEFLAQFDTFERDGRVTVEEFEDYYANISSTIDEDAYFHLLLWNSWQLDRPHPRSRSSGPAGATAAAPAAGARADIGGTSRW